jgi:hypothetical protein
VVIFGWETVLLLDDPESLWWIIPRHIDAGYYGDQYNEHTRMIIKNNKCGY